MSGEYPTGMLGEGVDVIEEQPIIDHVLIVGGQFGERAVVRHKL